MEEAFNCFGRKRTQQVKAHNTGAPSGRGRPQSKRWRYCSACSKLRRASQSAPGNDRRQQVQAFFRPGRPRMATTDENARRVNDMIDANWRITVNGAEDFEIGHERVHKFINHILGY
ncbi:hypothetical protein TNCV_612831 [Trichonephila clavipes]|nr:hypothetical protein TNCV_612831 [Trichonephila clavipes]